MRRVTGDWVELTGSGRPAAVGPGPPKPPPGQSTIDCLECRTGSKSTPKAACEEEVDGGLIGGEGAASEFGEEVGSGCKEGKRVAFGKETEGQAHGYKIPSRPTDIRDKRNSIESLRGGCRIV
ncbi:hypothetical protein NDU88_001459 [Pleurodeles waltl]|uniref:Uncharacterized protein n=1 Tax=Pleurodeles waltl TaxID=8319 RepID=A0AAV7VBR6_PLEWA|nr:hypothetical protein NDU88_001459 [Pleurodeles waltl]